MVHFRAFSPHRRYVKCEELFANNTFYSANYPPPYDIPTFSLTGTIHISYTASLGPNHYLQFAMPRGCFT